MALGSSHRREKQASSRAGKKNETKQNLGRENTKCAKKRSVTVRKKNNERRRCNKSNSRERERGGGGGPPPPPGGKKTNPQGGQRSQTKRLSPKQTSPTEKPELLNFHHKRGGGALRGVWPTLLTERCMLGYGPHASPVPITAPLA